MFIVCRLLYNKNKVIYISFILEWGIFLGMWFLIRFISQHMNVKIFDNAKHPQSGLYFKPGKPPYTFGSLLCVFLTMLVASRLALKRLLSFTACFPQCFLLVFSGMSGFCLWNYLPCRWKVDLDVWTELNPKYVLPHCWFQFHNTFFHQDHYPQFPQLGSKTHSPDVLGDYHCSNGE